MAFLSPSSRALAGLVLGLLAACSSSDDKKGAGQKPMSDSMASRVMNTDMNKRSSFESALVRSSSAGTGKHLQNRGFSTQDYTGNTRFKVPKTLQQRSFSGADDRSQLGEQAFQQAQSTNRFADDTFATPAAREGSLTASQQNDVFRSGQDTYRTGVMREAARSQAENKRPVIIKPKGAMQDDTPYTEDDIRRLLNRR